MMSLPEPMIAELDEQKNKYLILTDVNDDYSFSSIKFFEIDNNMFGDCTY